MFKNFKESRENPPAKPAHYVSGFENGYISSRCFLFSPFLQRATFRETCSGLAGRVKIGQREGERERASDKKLGQRAQ